MIGCVAIRAEGSASHWLHRAIRSFRYGLLRLGGSIAVRQCPRMRGGQRIVNPNGPASRHVNGVVLPPCYLAHSYGLVATLEDPLRARGNLTDGFSERGGQGHALGNRDVNAISKQPVVA